MQNKETVCLKDVISELKELEEAVIHSDIHGQKYVAPGHGFKTDEGKRRLAFYLKIKEESFYCRNPSYTVECNNDCGAAAFLIHREVLKIGETYEIPGYAALDKDSNLVIVSCQRYRNFERELSSFARMNESVLTTT